MNSYYEDIIRDILTVLRPEYEDDFKALKTDTNKLFWLKSMRNVYPKTEEEKYEEWEAKWTADDVRREINILIQVLKEKDIGERTRKGFQKLLDKLQERLKSDEPADEDPSQ